MLARCEHRVTVVGVLDWSLTRSLRYRLPTAAARGDGATAPAPEWAPILSLLAKKRKKGKARVLGLFGAVRRCSQVFFSARSIYAEVVDGEGEARSGG